MWQGAKRDLLTVPETFARHVKVGFNCQLTGSAEVGPWCHCRSEDESSVTGQCLRTHFDDLSATHPDGWAARLRFDADVVVHSSANPLLAAEIAFGCLHGDVTKKKLDLV